MASHEPENPAGTAANLVPGTVHGTVVQTGAVHGDVHVHQREPARPMPPRQLPAPPATLDGRDDDLAALSAAHSRLRSQPGPCVLALTGSGGVGKTSLALTYCTSVAAEFPDGQMFANCQLPDRNEPALIDDIVARFLRALGTPPADIPSGLSERTALWRSTTATLAVLIVLDDVASAGQVQALLPASVRSAVLATSRHPLLGLYAMNAEVLPVARLDHDASLSVLRSALGDARVAENPAAAAEIVRHCDGFPLALRVIAARLAARPDHSLEHGARELADERQRLDILSVDELSVRAAFELSYTALSPGSAAVYRLLGLHPGRLVCAELVAAGTGTTVPAARAELDTLVAFNLAQPHGEGLCTLHELVRLHAAETARRDQSDVDNENALQHMVNWYLVVAAGAGATAMPWRPAAAVPSADDAVPVPTDATRPDSAVSWLAEHHQDVMAALRCAADNGWHRLTCRLATALQPSFTLLKHDHDAIDAYTAGLHAARELQDWSFERDMLRRLARVHIGLGDAPTATALIDEAFSRATALGDRGAKSSAWKTRGYAALRTGDSDDAVRSFTESLNILTELGRNRSRGLCLIDLAAAHAERGGHGDLDAAATALDRAQELLSALSPPDSHGAARARLRQGEILLRSGNRDQAAALLQAAVKHLEDLGAPYDAAQAHYALAAVARQDGDGERAHRHTSTADALMTTAGRAPRPR